MKEHDVASHLQEEKILLNQHLARAAAAKEAGSDQEKRSVGVWQSQQRSAWHTLQEDKAGKEAAEAVNERFRAALAARIFRRDRQDKLQKEVVDATSKSSTLLHTMHQPLSTAAIERGGQRVASDSLTHKITPSNTDSDLALKSRSSAVLAAVQRHAKLPAWARAYLGGCISCH